MTDDPPDLVRERQGGPDRHLYPLLGFDVRLGRKVGYRRDTDRHTLHEQRVRRPWKQLRQVVVRRYALDAIGVGRQADVHDLPVGTDRQQGTAVDLEEVPETLQGSLDRMIELFRRDREERGGRVGDQRLELETVLEAISSRKRLLGHQRSAEG